MYFYYPSRGKIFSVVHVGPDLAWGPSNLLFSGYRTLSRGQNGPRVALAFHPDQNVYSCTLCLRGVLRVQRL